MRDTIRNAKRIVVKVGTSTLTHQTGRLNLQRIEHIVRQIADLANQGKEMVLVSSGAVAAGLPALGLQEKPRDLGKRQAAASVGQGLLLHMYEKLFREYGHTVGQILLTREDTVKHSHYVSLRNTFHAMLEYGVIPIINENDVVAIEEFKIGDNDTLSANVASIVEADLLLILSDIDGLYTANPQTDPTASLISEVKEITPEIFAMAGGAGTQRGTGGMFTKIQAGHIAVHCGVPMVIASGEMENSILRLMNGEPIGTYFAAQNTVPHAKKRWMAFGTRVLGVIHVDEGAKRALLDKGSSLLPAGVVSVSGDFNEGDTVKVCYDGVEIARGITNYAARDVEHIKGCQSQDIASTLGVSTTYEEVIHRDNLVVLR